MIKIAKIEKVIAKDAWSYRGKGGKIVTSTIMVGRPFANPEDRNWVCPVSIEGYIPGIIPLGGVGPVDALINAMTLVRSFLDKYQDNFIPDFSAVAKRNKPAKSSGRRRHPRRA